MSVIKYSEFGRLNIPSTTYYGMTSADLTNVPNPKFGDKIILIGTGTTTLYIYGDDSAWHQQTDVTFATGIAF
jgi:hypothetical protein